MIQNCIIASIPKILSVFSFCDVVFPLVHVSIISNSAIFFKKLEVNFIFDFAPHYLRQY